MITYITNKINDDETSYIEIACISTDVKPTNGVSTGSICLEVDSGKMYAYNSSTELWVEQGGGGSSPSPVRIETIIGTVSEPFGDYSVENLAYSMVHHDCTMYMQIDASVLGRGTLEFPLFAVDSELIYGMLANPVNDSMDAGFISWLGSNDELGAFSMLSSGTLVDLTQYASTMPTTVTLIIHPIE